MTAAGGIPYVIGPWVRGERFYGREQLLADLLGRRDGASWAAGCRRVGKTSLLRELERLAVGRRMVPVVWDLQGAADRDELRLSFEDALLDAESALGGLGIGTHEIAGDEPAEMVAALAAAVRRRELEPLVLVDEAEELLGLAGTDPEAVADLEAALVGPAAPRLVLASSVRLGTLADASGPSRWLRTALTDRHDVGPLSDRSARDLVRQLQLPESERPALSDAAVAAIAEHCGGHPFLLQLLAKRTLEAGDVDRATAAVAADQAVRRMVEVDLGLLDPADRDLVRTVAAGTKVEASPATARLAALGLLRHDPATGRPRPGHLFMG